MSETLNMHYVATYDEACDLVAAHRRWFVTKCGCRVEQGSKCKRSPLEVCLEFHPRPPDSKVKQKLLTKEQVDELMIACREQGLVVRPFRDMKAPEKTDGICFCCDDCCGYFLDPKEACDKGALVEKTTIRACTHCGLCVPVCFFKARKMKDKKLVVKHDECYGCGLCAEVCPEACVDMVARALER